MGREREEFNKLDEPPNKTHDELRMNTELRRKLIIRKQIHIHKSIEFTRNEQLILILKIY